MNEQSSVHQIIKLLESRPKTLIVGHNNPDPDCIASCQAMKYLLSKTLKLNTRIVCGGYIGRAENQEMINHLKIEVETIRKLKSQNYEYIILIDTQESFENHLPLPKESRIISVDHHPLRKRKKHTVYSDIRPVYGATSTIFTEYLLELGLSIDPLLATALYYGIKADTLDFSRSYTNHDFDAFKNLFPLIKNHLLGRILHPSLPRSYLVEFAQAVENARIYGKTVIVPLGTIEYPDLVAEIADLFLRLNKITWSLCYGVYQSELNISLRTTSRVRNAGHIIKKVAGKQGSAGGHEMSGAAQIPLPDSLGKLEEFIQSFIDRYLKTLGVKQTMGIPLIQKDTHIIQKVTE